MESKEIAERFLEMYKKNKIEEIIPFITGLFDNEEEILKKIIDVQIQIKELGGGWPPVGEQISTMKEILAYSKLAINYALDKDNKLAAGILNHNVSSFCFPNMDDGVDENFIEPGYQAAVRDLELRREIGDKVPMMWSMWLVGVSEFIKGDISSSIKTLEELKKIAMEDTPNEGLAAWADMMKVKFQIKSRLVSREDATKEVNRIEAILTKQQDEYGLNTLEEIKKL